MATLAVLILGVACAGFAQALPDQNYSKLPYTMAQDSRDLFTELGRDVIRPSHLGGGHLYAEKLPAVAVSTSETTQQFRLETDLWQLELEKTTWRLRLTNKKSGAVWEFGPTPSHPAGIWWEGTEVEATHSTFAITGVRQLHKNGDRWIVQGNIGKSSSSAAVEIAVLSPNIIDCRSRRLLREVACTSDLVLSAMVHFLGWENGLSERKWMV
jgi:hypothetical protein